MTYSDWINIVSTLITIASTAFGIWGLYVTYFNKKYPGKVSYIPIQTVRIYENIVTAFPEISITYNNEPINQELVYHRAAIINNGMIDINKQMIDEPISLKLKQGAWKEVKIKNSFLKKIKILTFNDDKIEIRFKLFRINEVIHFETLSTISNEKGSEFEENIIINHRISETQNIKILNKVSEEDIKREKSKLKFYIILNAIMLAFIAIFIGIEIYNLQNGMFVKLPNSNDLYIKSRNGSIHEFISISTNKIAVVKRNEINKILYKIYQPNFQEKINIFRSKGIIFPFSIYPMLFSIVVFMQWLEKRRKEKQFQKINFT